MSYRADNLGEIGVRSTKGASKIVAKVGVKNQTIAKDTGCALSALCLECPRPICVWDETPKNRSQIYQELGEPVPNHC